MYNVEIALWSRSTQDKTYQSINKKISHLYQALTKFGRRIDWLNARFGANFIPGNQHVRGIFVAPEYYFTQAGAGGGLTPTNTTFGSRSLSEADKDRAVRSLKMMSAKFPGILIVPGTIAWRKPLARPLNKQISSKTGYAKQFSRSYKAIESLKLAQQTGLGTQRNLMYATSFNPGYIMEYFNLNGIYNSPQNQNLAYNDPNFLNWLQERYPHVFSSMPTEQQKAWKIHLGQVQYMMRNTAYILINGQVIFKYNKRGDWHEAIATRGDTTFVPGGMAGRFMYSGYPFTIEICLDHFLGASFRDAPAPPGNYFHIVTSASVLNNVGNMNVIEGGYFIHASSDISQTTVGKRILGLMTPQNRVNYFNLVDGNPLQYWSIQTP
jgi:hypothetical protein